MRRNPFRARNISPGCLPYVFPLGHDTDQLLQRFRENKFRGQIVGPHGSGKSTLLVHLKNALENLGHDVQVAWLEPASSGGRGAAKKRLRQVEQAVEQRMAKRTSAETDRDTRPVIAVDGLEILPWLERKRFFRLARQNECGILATAHQDLGLPTLWETQVDLERAEKVIAELFRLDAIRNDADVASEDETNHGTASQTEKSSIPVVPAELIADLLSRHDGDMREVLFSLYDWFQDRT